MWRRQKAYDKLMQKDPHFRETESNSLMFIILGTLWLIFGIIPLFYLDIDFIFYFIILTVLYGKGFDEKLKYNSQSCMNEIIGIVSFFFIYLVYNELVYGNHILMPFILSVITYLIIQLIRKPKAENNT